MGSTVPGADMEPLVEDYARCAAWAAQSGADAIEVHLATPNPLSEQVQMIYENVPLSAHILYRVRTTVTVPVLAKLGAFKTPRLLHETATKLAPWASGFVLVHGLTRKVVNDKGAAAFEGAGRERAEVVGAQTLEVASRQVEEPLSWREALAWDRDILAARGHARRAARYACRVRRGAHRPSRRLRPHPRPGPPPGRLERVCYATTRALADSPSV